ASRRSFSRSGRGRYALLERSSRKTRQRSSSTFRCSSFRRSCWWPGWRCGGAARASDSGAGRRRLRDQPMKFRNTVILALLVAGFGAYLYFVERPAAQKEVKKQTVVEFDRDKVSEVSLKYPDHEIVLKKVDGNWRMTAPIATDADQMTVKNLVGAIAD